MKVSEIKSTLPSYYTEEEKEKMVLLLIELANIYLKTEKEE